MKLLKSIIHPNLESLEGKIYKRITARGVIIKDFKVLFMYTKRYNDYTFPGGGVDSEEHLIDGLKRELLEETGALDVTIIKELGFIEDFRPYTKDGYDIIHEISHFYLCSVSKFGKPQYEEYEIKNGMENVWITLQEAITHNKNIIESKHDSLGLSIVRETEAMEIINHMLKKQ